MSKLGSLYIRLGEPEGELLGGCCEIDDWAADEIERLKTEIALWKGNCDCGILATQKLEQQLAEVQKQIVMLREAVASVVNMDFNYYPKCYKAIYATKDLSGLVLCDAEPVAWRYENKNVKGNWYITWTKPDDSFNQRGLHERKQP